MDWNERLRDIAELVHGKTVGLLGSSPNNNGLPSVANVLASVNAGACGFGVNSIDIHFLNSSSQATKSRIGSLVMDGIKGLVSKHSVYIDASRFGAPPYVNSIVVSRSDRASLYNWASGGDFKDSDGGDKVPSTGIAAALILKKLGANVVLCGFSLDDGHSLDETSLRQHKAVDSRYINDFEHY